MSDAAAAMTAALDQVAPQHTLLRQTIESLVGQDRASRALGRKMRGLLPRTCLYEDRIARERLDSLTASIERVRSPSSALTQLSTGLPKMLEHLMPHELASAYTAENFDFAADPSARSHLVITQSAAEPVTHTLLLNELLTNYEADISADALGVLLTNEPDFACNQLLGPPNRWGTAPTDMLNASLSEFRTLCDSCGPRAPAAHSQPPETSTPVNQGPKPSLAFGDVFDFADDSPWIPLARTYFPYFDFVTDGLAEFRLIENAWRRLAQEAHTIRADVAEQPVEEIVGPHAQDSVGPILDQPATVIAALIGEKIFDITRARRLTWLMVAYNVAVQRVLADTRAAACKLADHVAWVLADQRATYLRAIGHPPKVDSIDPAEIRKVAGDHQWWTEQHLLVAKTLLASGSGSANEAMIRSLAQATELKAASSASLLADRNLLALSRLTTAQLPLGQAGFPGLTFQQITLSQTRPLAAIAIAHQLVVTRWIVKAMRAYLARRHALALALCDAVEQHDGVLFDLIGALDSAIRTEKGSHGREP